MPTIRKDKDDKTFDKCNVTISNSNLPRISGYTASFISSVLASSVSYQVSKIIKKYLVAFYLPEVYAGDPTPMPVLPAKYFPVENADLVGQIKNLNLQSFSKNWPYYTIQDYADIYRSKIVSPSEVANNILKICQSERIRLLNAISQINCDNVIKAAKLSDMRYKTESPLSILDGVPFFVKHCINIDTYNLGNGFVFEEKVSTETAGCVQVLIDAGAILIGTVSMTAFGLNTVGFNSSKQFPSCRNPWDINRYSGGSSTGSAIVVAAGLCPFAIGTDSLGSIRIPSALNGVVGFRPTFSRISREGRVPDNSHNPQHVTGPIACSVSDAAIVYHIMASKASLSEENSSSSINNNPKPFFSSCSEMEIKKLRFSYNSEYNKGANDSIFAMFQTVIEKLKSKDISVTDIDFPFLYEIHVGAMKSTGSRLVSKLRNANISTRSINDIFIHIVLSQNDCIDQEELEIIDRERTRAINNFHHIFSNTDILVMPTTRCIAQLIAPGDDYNGFYDDIYFEHMFYSNISSFIGIPSISLNVGYDSITGMPIGIQLMSDWWREDLVIAAAEYIESLFPLNRRPGVFESPLEPV